MKTILIPKIIPAAFFSALILWGCVTPRQQLLDPPVVTFDGMDLKHISFFEAVPRFDFTVANSNPMGMKIKSIDYTLKINHQKFVKGVAGQNIRIKAADSGNVRLTVRFNYLDVFEMIPEFRHKDQIQYTLSVQAHIGAFSIPYQTDGWFSIPKIPELSLKNGRVSELTSSGAKAVFVLEARNHNPFPIKIKGMSYTIRLGGHVLADGNFSEPLTLDPTGKTEVHLTVDADFSGPDRGMYETLACSGAPYELSGEMFFDTSSRGRKSLGFKTSGEVLLER
jgi:LEA14-like dessication related protein